MLPSRIGSPRISIPVRGRDTAEDDKRWKSGWRRLTNRTSVGPESNEGPDNFINVPAISHYATTESQKVPIHHVPVNSATS